MQEVRMDFLNGVILTIRTFVTGSVINFIFLAICALAFMFIGFKLVNLLVKILKKNKNFKKLEDSGFVRRECDENDQRAIRVYLTEQGKALHRSTIGRLRENDAILMEGISEEEQAVLLQLLTKMRDNMLQTLEREQEK